MKIIHTADWHLGQRLYDRERTEEHRAFLNWLIGIIREREIEALIHAGDVFDSPNPPNHALAMYYDFLRELVQTTCTQAVIIGGNHDSPATLNAPRELLRYFRIHIIGGAPQERADEVIELYDGAGEVAALVAAVPFLRERDIRKAVAGQTFDERERQIKEGIGRHYDQARDTALGIRRDDIPLLATGHLFAAGGSTSDSEKDIHVGNLGQISAKRFPSDFDYIALGHLHRPQIVGGNESIRYAGSPIALSFSERNDRKHTLMIELEGNAAPPRIETLETPQFRRLARLQGDYTALKDGIDAFDNNGCPFPAWAEVVVELNEFDPDADARVRALTELRSDIEIVRVNAQYRRNDNEPNGAAPPIDLSELSIEEVFLRKCEADNVGADRAEYVASLRELIELMNDEAAR